MLALSYYDKNQMKPLNGELSLLKLLVFSSREVGKIVFVISAMILSPAQYPLCPLTTKLMKLPDSSDSTLSSHMASEQSVVSPGIL